jgi:hypothetical protein
MSFSATVEYVRGLIDSIKLELSTMQVFYTGAQKRRPLGRSHLDTVDQLPCSNLPTEDELDDNANKIDGSERILYRQLHQGRRFSTDIKKHMEMRGESHGVNSERALFLHQCLQASNEIPQQKELYGFLVEGSYQMDRLGYGLSWGFCDFNV